MSTLAGTIVVQAFREGNFVAAGETPTAAELAEGLTKLNNFLAALFGFEVGEQFREWNVPTTYEQSAPLRYPPPDAPAYPWMTPPPNARLLVSLVTDGVIYFPAAPSDGARMALVDVGSSAYVTLHGNGRKIGGELSFTAAPDLMSGNTWLYRADLGNWIVLQPELVEDDEVPLPPEFDDLLVCGLAMRMAPRYGVEISNTTATCYVNMLERLKQRYKQREAMPSNAESSAALRSTPYSEF